MNKSNKQRILGIDPGSRLCGWGVIECQGNKSELLIADTIDLRDLESDTDKLIKIYDEVTQVIKDSLPHKASIESPFYHKNPQTLIKLTQARSAAIIAIKNQNIELAEFSPLEVKKTLTGRGRADKTQVAYMVSTILNTSLDHLNNDATDALAIALCANYRTEGSQSQNKRKKTSDWGAFIKQNPDKIIGAK